MSQALTLYRLQQIDSETDRVQARLDFIDRTLKDDASIKQAILLAEATTVELSTSEEFQKNADAEVRNLRIKIEQTESSLYGGMVRNPKELLDLQNEAAALKRHLLILDDRLLESMLATEEIQVRNEKAQAQLVTAQYNWDEESRSLHQEQVSLHKDLQKLITERLAITNSLAPDQIHLYDQIRTQRQGLAVTGIQENTCIACGTTLTLALVQTARSSGQISRCPSCGRILYGS
jgi:uncharacterized protein